MAADFRSNELFSDGSDVGLHPYANRVSLNNEVHSRPFITINSPARCTNIAMLHGPEGAAGHDAAAEWAHLEKLCAHYGVALSSDVKNHLIVDFGSFQLKWERHTEFSSYTFLRDGAGKDSFEDSALQVVPEHWLKNLPGQMLVGVHLVVQASRGEAPYDPETLKEVFGTNGLIGARVSGGCATAWTDFRLHKDGFTRILVQNISMSRHQTGRLLQRLWEIETYRMMALLSMTHTGDVGAQTRAIELKLARHVGRMANVHDEDKEQELLEILTGLAAEVEQLSAQTSFRFNASKAYYALVLKRIDNIKEQHIEGIQRLSSFIDRRMAPAMRTVESMDERISILSRRVNRASNLLQVRINTTLQAQNKELLKSMDRRAQLQLRLQQTVEGLSVVAISYYALGIVKIVAQAGGKIWPLPDATVITAACSPFVIGLVYYGIHRVRRYVDKAV
ncbi:DUF3422 family protein [Paremcibacter congregatus]|uniref:DUF3422 family protein n=1 Tax=Paremcibacter congregatus TaxID=2043170 RepID=UPI003A8D7F71